ncbi:hypothetical protein [Candidatus Chazhemtobacterium aquaticus]|uniref:Uncharacterized protein n=1 Tax=Candidatus Chazhemtobacterium aquaticus TaxID=2715735 RepID=A0A857N526_9BACT|nr:hypothetical protein [Candidatus Chazhemtobacterium aquaticus]QHO63237.1 hypothetical protein MICH65_0256 [Candidatus Chazhemtobacterium aquaticus]
MSKPERRVGNYWMTAIITLTWWFILGGMILWVDPEVVADYPLPGSYGLFFLFLFLGVWFLASLVLSNSRRGLLVAIWFVLIGYLQIWGLANLVNMGLLTGALVALEIYKGGGKLKRG